MIKSKDKEFSEGLARGLEVIEAFSAERPELTLSEIARLTGHSPAAVRRCLFTFISLGYMRQIERRFLLTPKILVLGAAYFQSAHIEDALLPELRGFVDMFGDAASVAVLSEGNTLYVAHHASPSGMRPVAGTGVTYPAHATSMGKVLLALGGEAQLDAFLATPLRAMTDVTVTDPDRFRALMAEIRRQGYATSVDQLAYGVTSLAVPISLPSGQVVAAVNTSGYSGRVTPESLVAERLAPLRSLAGRVATILQRTPALLHSLGRES